MYRREALFIMLLLSMLISATEIDVVDPEPVETGVIIAQEGEYLDVREVVTVHGSAGKKVAFTVPSLISEGPDLVLDPTALPANTSSLVTLEAYSCPTAPVHSFRTLDGCRRRDPTRVTGRLLSVGDGTVVEENDTGDRFLLLTTEEESLVFRYRVLLDPLVTDLDPSFQFVKPYLKSADTFDLRFENTPCSTWTLLTHTVASEDDVATEDGPGLLRLYGTRMTGGYLVKLGLISCATLQEYFKQQYLVHVDEPAVRELATTIATNANSSSIERQAEELFYYVRDTINYKRDRFAPGQDFPESPRQTLETKLGDCEDMSILLISMLRTIGLDARLVLMDLDRSGTDFTIRELMEGNSLTFNHVAVMASFGPDGRFDRSSAKIMDATCKECLFGEATVEGVPSLVIDSDDVIFPIRSSGECEGMKCGTRCYSGLGRCCSDWDGEEWRPNQECCNSADCLGNSLCENGQCAVCDGRICGGVCYSRKDHKRPCCSHLDCGTFEWCEQYSCTLDNSRLTTVGAGLLGFIVLFLVYRLLRRTTCPHCGAHIPARSSFCTACGDEILSSEEEERRAEVDAIKRYAVQARKRGASFDTIADRLLEREYETDVVDLVLGDVRNEESRPKRKPKKKSNSGLDEAMQYVLARREEGFSDEAILHSLEQRGYQPDVVSKAMSDEGQVDRIRRYIASRREEGFSEREIQEALAHAGYAAHDVREALAPLTKGPSTDDTFNELS
ncbi:MAG: transglutaminase domain-containing protein [Candidatus Undinarchaeales archaeon]|jgi:predicted nucleic acid-binding Zn ribbon protein|nr:transglutaminase domain-containing protein [Candidatus Undinarchaeales archaeon]